MNISEFKGRRIHMIGIGGSSMSGLAEMLLRQGYTVTGSDNALSHTVERLREHGIPVVIGHQRENVHGAGLIIYSAAILEDNPERVEAKSLGIPEMERAELLGQLMENYKQVICVAGTHGKTTVSGMIAQCLQSLGKDPTVQLGGRVDAIGGNWRIGESGCFVAEACEYHGSFLWMHPTVALITNIQEDHLDYYRDIDDIQNAFGRFLSLLPENGLAVGCGDDERIRALFAELNLKTVTYGLRPDNDYSAADIHYAQNGQASFTAVKDGNALARISLKVIGEHNLMDALGAFALLHALDLPAQEIAESLGEFIGARRRFEMTGTVDGVALYHDYGHNPAEMRTAIHSAVCQHPNRVWAVMQPHTFSRVKRLYRDYLTCTEEADITLVTDIYAAREKDPGDIHSSQLVADMRANGIDAHLTPTFDDTEDYLRKHWRKGDLMITMGCGNINLLNEQIQAHGDTVPAAD